MMMAPMGNSSLVNRRSGFHGEIEDSSAIPDAIGYPVEFSAGNQVVCRYAAFQSVFFTSFPVAGCGTLSGSDREGRRCRNLQFYTEKVTSCLFRRFFADKGAH